MTTPPRPDVSDEGQPLSGAGEGHTGDAAHDETPVDPPNPASKPQGTLQDQEANMESEGQPAQPVGPETTSKD
jgi:hypothetical protein